MYVVVDTDINRVLGAYATQEQALAFVVRILETNGDAYAEELAVGRRTDDDEYTDVVSGSALVTRVNGIRREQGRSAGRSHETVRSYGGSDDGESAAMAAKGIAK